MAAGKGILYKEHHPKDFPNPRCTGYGSALSEFIPCRKMTKVHAETLNESNICCIEN